MAASVALALVVTQLSSAAQSEAGAPADLPTIRGRVVRDSDGSNVVGALVEAHPAFRIRETTRTDDRGEFARIGSPESHHTTATNHEPYDFVQCLTISAPGLARTIVDPCADAPWAAPVRVRRTGTLRGRVTGAPAGQVNHLVAIANSRDLCWPPRTGLTGVDPRWLGDLDVDGRFDIHDVPAEVPIELCWNAGTSSGRGIVVVGSFALAPGEVREFVLAAPDPSLAKSDIPVATEGPWIPVTPGEIESSRASANLVAFELADGWRFQRHKNGGGRAHVHGARACNHLEALPGPRTLIGFDARGRIGLETFDVRATDVRVVPLVALAPGALLRIAFDGPEERARIALVSRGIEYAARELPRGVVWYELAPAGPIQIRVTSASAEPRTVDVEAHAGRIENVAL